MRLLCVTSPDKDRLELDSSDSLILKVYGLLKEARYAIKTHLLEQQS